MTDMIFNEKNELRQVERDLPGIFMGCISRCAKSGLQTTWNVILTEVAVGWLIEPERH